MPPTTELPTGTWNYFGNNEQGKLNIASIDQNGKLTGTLDASAVGQPIISSQITGTFGSSKGELQFVRKLSDQESFKYTGYISIVSIGVDSPQYLLGGWYEVKGSKAKQGWYATIMKIVA